ncbi:tRNA splicing endonuclease subunit [Aspergillus neoniger CBS 115656]|uniref:tRNA splicing endonuclease subunit n=1 Tax=Aspergillus neoniger (strain CBS 115656) TaxID=1448310 RepID=A0A318YK61_ASPNB|nr:tRNA splicing endonuclease subunit [Aspergillus neoniger CBS 115656]PYH34207.1 tRNA splicing endonuclease subunit [Aspergillus neoniger CBS 115656]
MADIDEAVIHMPSQDASAHIDTDLSDETQDFRMLNSISFLTDGSQQSLPKRGEKDFEPNPTLFQADILSASRQAMHNALSYPRLHHPKTQVVGIYSPNGPIPLRSAQRLDTITEESEPSKPAGTDIGVHPDSCVYVPAPKGQYFKSIGQADRWNRVWLLPEEALYLLERGTLDIRWPCSEVGCTDDEGTDDSGIPMSLQAAYAAFMGRSGLTSERYSVYTGLRRLGYTIIRAPGWHDAEEGAETSESQQIALEKPQGLGLGIAGVFRQLLQWLYKPGSATTALGPVVGLGIHRSYDDIYQKLSIIPWYDPTASPSPPPPTTPPYRVVFQIYKPSTPFKKSAPPTPDFRLAVVNARTHTTIPTSAQLGALLESTPLDPPVGEKMSRQLYQRLRYGYRNVILAVVDEGVVSYLRIADSAFGKEKLYKQQNTKGNKGPWRPRPKGR